MDKAYHAAYMRRWRSDRIQSPLQRLKSNARSYANVYKRRGKLLSEACACGSMDVEMHHDDYTKPLQVTWMCRACHLAHHAPKPQPMRSFKHIDALLSRRL